MTERKNVYFTSDAHLGSGYHQDPKEVERRLVRWLEYIRPHARAVYFLGDIFDYWFEYHSVVPRGYVRFLGKVAEMADEGIEIHFFAGNHDVWFSDYMQTELGASVHHKLFRNKLARLLYAAIHPRWTVGFAMAWSLHSRKQGLKRQTLGNIPHAYHNEYFEVEEEHLVKCTKQYLEQYPEIEYYLYGHRHILLDLSLKGGKRMCILGDWLRYNSYAVWNGEYLLLEQFEVDE